MWSHIYSQECSSIWVLTTYILSSMFWAPSLKTKTCLILNAASGSHKYWILLVHKYPILFAAGWMVKTFVQLHVLLTNDEETDYCFISSESCLYLLKTLNYQVTSHNQLMEREVPLAVLAVCLFFFACSCLVTEIEI